MKRMVKKFITSVSPGVEWKMSTSYVSCIILKTSIVSPRICLYFKVGKFK